MTWVLVDAEVACSLRWLMCATRCFIRGRCRGGVPIRLCSHIEGLGGFAIFYLGSPTLYSASRFALLVVGLLLLLLACLYGGWVVVGEREDWRRGTGQHLHARPGEGSYHGKVPPPPPPPVAAVKPTPPTVTERRPPRRIPRRGLVDPVRPITVPRYDSVPRLELGFTSSTGGRAPRECGRGHPGGLCTLERQTTDLE